VAHEVLQSANVLAWFCHTELHWLDAPERVAYKLSVMMYSCKHGRGPQYLMDFCYPTSSVVSRQQLRSVSQRLLVVPHCQLSTTSRQAFTVVGLSVWYSLPDYLHDSGVGRGTVRQNLKTFILASY